MHATQYWVWSFVVLTPIDLLLVHEMKVVAITSRCVFLANMIYNLLCSDMLYLINNKFLAWKFSCMPQKDLLILITTAIQQFPSTTYEMLQ
jgi:predicted membrane channel-forming protein YqfA (hemolysin III family)